MKSIFIDKNVKPGSQDLRREIGKTYPVWQRFENFVLKERAGARSDWHFSGTKFGWSYRIKDDKRVLLYLLPRKKFFKVAFVFGQKAANEVIGSDISEEIKAELNRAKVYAEGRGIRIDVRDDSKSRDIETLVKIKIAN